MRLAFSHAFCRVAVVFAGALALASCAGNSSDTWGGAGASQPQSIPNAGGLLQNDAGQYSGTVNDTTFGSGSASASLAQDEGTVGGVLTTTFGTTSFANSVALKTSDGLSLAGAQVGEESGTCSYSINASYNTHSFVLKGTYKAVHGCAGESGSFSITKECYYPRKGLLDAVPSWNRNPGMKPDNGLHQC